MLNNQKKDLPGTDAFGIMSNLIRKRLEQIGDYGTIEFNIKLEKHDGIVKDAYLGWRTENGFVVTEHLR